MTSQQIADELLPQWQNNKHLPKEVRLEQDYDAMLDVIEFALNTPDGIQGERAK